MRKIINSTYISLDGVIEAPHEWPPTEPSDPASERIQTDLLLSCDAIVMGRHTYEGFAPVWPMRSGDPYSDHINAMRKYVVSSKLEDPGWSNTTVIDGDPVVGTPRWRAFGSMAPRLSRAAWSSCPTALPDDPGHSLPARIARPTTGG